MSLSPSPRALPEARDPSRPYRICVVCLGNICRSPIAEVVLTERIRRAGLEPGVAVDSAGTGGWHVGEDMDPRSRRVLVSAGYAPGRHRARRFDPAWFGELDLVLAMDRQNLDDLRSAARGGIRPGGADRKTLDGRIMMFGSFAGLGAVPDPYTGGQEGFGGVLDLVERAAEALVDRHLAALATRR